MSVRPNRPERAFTLIELLVAIAVVSLLITLAAPSFMSMILMQRLKSINAQLVTDLQFARAEAAARSVPVRVQFSVDGGQTCYGIFTGSAIGCDCGVPAPFTCDAVSQMIRVVSVPRNLGVTVSTAMNPQTFAFDPATGAVIFGSLDIGADPTLPFVITAAIDGPRTLRTEVKLSGRPGVCAPPGSTMDVPAC